MDDLHFLEKLSKNFKGARKTIPFTRKAQFQLDVMDSRWMTRNAMPRGINVQSAYMSNSLNSGFSLSTSTSNSSSFNTSGNKLEISKGKIRNAANCNEQSKVLSESTYGETKSSAMSSQTKTNSIENDRKIYGKRPLLYSDFRNNFSKKVLIQSFQPICCRNNITNKDFSNTREGYCSAQVVNYQFPEDMLTSTQSNKKGVTNTPKNDSTIMCIDNTYPHHSRRKQARPLKSVRVSGKENEMPETPNKIILLEKSLKYEIERPKTYDKYLPNKMNLQRILIKRNAEGRWFQNYVPSNYIKTIRANAIPHTSLVQSEFLKSDLRSMLEDQPTFAHSSSAHELYKHAFSSTNRMIHRPLLYKPAAKKEFDAKQYKFILPQPTTARHYELGGSEIARLAAENSTKPSSTDGQNHFKPGSVKDNFGRRGNLTMHQAQQGTRCSDENSHASSIAPLILVFPKAPNVPKNTPVTLASDHGIRSSTVVKECVDEQGTKNEKRTSDNIGVTCKVQRTKFALMKFFEVLLDISETLSSDFECPAGLELSLPIWKSELDRCIVSMEKIQSIISEKEKIWKAQNF